MANNSDYVKKMRTKCFDIEAGKLVAILHEKDAKELGLLKLDRVEIKNPQTKADTVTVADITSTMVKEGEIGIFKDVNERIACDAIVEVRAVPKPNSVWFIKKKMRGEKLTPDEITEIVKDIANNRLSEIEASSFMTSVYIHGFDLDETVSMTKALLYNGKKLKLSKTPVVDKHSIGGLNGRATMIVVPIVAAAGLYIPKTSSRAITSCGGTADSMEVLSNVSLSIDEIKRITETVGGVIVWGGSVDLAPADDKIIKIEYPLSLDPEGQVIASVLAKKASVGAQYVVIDLPVGPDVKVKTKERAEEMAKKFVEVGKKLGMKVEAVITNGDDPSGNAFGPALEAKHVMQILEGKIYDNLAQKSCELAGVLFELAGKVKDGKGFDLAKEILTSGKALKKMQEIIKAQGGKITNSNEIALSDMKSCIKANEDGDISKINVALLIRIARIAGAPADKKAGVYLHVETGKKVQKGDALFDIYAENQTKLALAEEFAKKNNVVELQKIILEKFV